MWMLFSPGMRFFFEAAGVPGQTLRRSNREG